MNYSWTHITLWTSIIVIIVFIISYWFPSVEGFISGPIAVGESPFWARFFPRRGDVGAEDEEPGYHRDPRYFAGYVDVQRLGVPHDFCRTVVPPAGDADAFIACALAGTEGLSTVSYRSPSIKNGLKRSRDDYMRDVNGDGRADYCSIIPHSGSAPEVLCYKSGESSITSSTLTDTAPPDDIALLMQFYDGAMVWLRMRDDLADYADAAQVSRAGKIETPEYIPRDQPTQGIQFNGHDQFLRLGEKVGVSVGPNASAKYEFGTKIPLRYMRAVSCWAYFDEFTNNARIFDFGNGAGRDNVFLGIVGQGSSISQEQSPLLCGGGNTVPDSPSGAQPVQLLTPQQIAEETQGNSCPNPEITGKKMQPLQPQSQGPSAQADLIYEIWDAKDRKMRIIVPAVIPLKRWTHIAVTALNNDALRPDILVFIDGKLAHKEPAGHLPQSSTTKNNYIGKSNWSNTFSQYTNNDELFKGSLFDFRMYATPMTPQKIQDTVRWGKSQLNIE